MHARIAKWGNSLALRLPKPLADGLGLTDGSEVELNLADGRLELTPARPSYKLNDLLDGISTENQPASFDDGAIGKEAL